MGAEISALRAERDRFVALAFCAADMLLEINAERQVSFTSGATVAITGLSADKLMRRPVAALVFAADQPKLDSFLKQLGLSGQRLLTRLRFNGPFGPTAPLAVAGYSLPQLADRLFLTLRWINDAAPPPADSRRDPASGVLDTLSFSEQVGHRVAHDRSGGLPQRMTILEVDNLPPLIKRLDEARRAELSKTIGDILKSNSTGGDTAARFDDTRFGLMHGAGVDIAGLSRRIESVASKLDPRGPGLSVQPTTIDLDDGGGGPETVRRALLYTISEFCRQEGQFEIRRLSDSLPQLAVETDRRLAALHRVIAKREFTIAFQPIVDLRSRIPHHFEALVRFDDASLAGSPYEFIVFAEEVGQIAEFDLAMCEMVLQRLQDACRDGYRYMIAANLSGRSLESADFVARLHALLERYDDVRDSILFELTESAHVTEIQSVNEVLQSLRARGHNICLDDFGTGSAAFRYLSTLDVDVVKIDGVYVREAMSNVKSGAMIRALSGLCHELGIAVVGEMVEDERSASFLEESGVRLGQGSLFGMPQSQLGEFAAPRPALFSRGPLRGRL